MSAYAEGVEPARTADTSSAPVSGRFGQASVQYLESGLDDACRVLACWLDMKTSGRFGRPVAGYQTIATALGWKAEKASAHVRHLCDRGLAEVTGEGREAIKVRLIHNAARGMISVTADIPPVKRRYRKPSIYKNTVRRSPVPSQSPGIGGDVTRHRGTSTADRPPDFGGLPRYLSGVDEVSGALASRTTASVQQAMIVERQEETRPAAPPRFEARVGDDRCPRCRGLSHDTPFNPSADLLDSCTCPEPYTGSIM